MKLRIATFVIGFISAILCLSQKPAQTQQVVWSSIDGCAKDIGGNDNSAWVIGCAPSSVGYGNEIWTWGSNSTSGWNKVYGGASAIAVSSTGTPWIVNSKGDIFQRSNGSWQGAGSCAKDIGVGRDDNVWIIGCNPSSTGYGNEILYRSGSGWNKVNGGAIRISVSATGSAWVVNSKGDIFQRSNGSWKGVGGCAKDIGVGSGDDVWVIGCAKSTTGAGNEIWTWNGKRWNKVNGGGIRISVSSNGTPWVIDAFEKSWHL